VRAREIADPGPSSREFRHAAWLSRAVIGVDTHQALLEQVRAKAGSLTSTIDPEPGEIPVGIPRMRGIHLF
jgi:hypothetical protein